MCGWHTQSNTLRKWSQWSSVAFTSLRKNNNVTRCEMLWACMSIVAMWMDTDQPYFPSFSQQLRQLVLPPFTCNIASVCKSQN